MHFFLFVIGINFFFLVGFLRFDVFIVVLQGRFATGSPQSTLCAFGSDCKCRKGSSSQGSPNGVREIASSNSTLNLLHAAADEVETLRLNQQSVVPQRNCSPVTLPSNNNNNNTVSPNDLSFFAPPSLSHYQLQIAQVSLIFHKSHILTNGVFIFY